MADFKFYLNRQGPKGEPGAKGEKGDNGNTPVFSDGINTPTVYTMQIDMGDGNVFETQNLKYPMRDDGGNYLRYNRTDSIVTLSAPNIADLQRTMGEVTLASVSDVESEEAQDTDAVSMELRNADQLALDNEIDRIDRDIDTVDDKVDREIQGRQDADTQLTNKINTDVSNEAIARSNADAGLSGRIDNLIASKANKSDVYTKTQTDTLLNGKANTVHTHSLSQITDAGSLAGKNTVDYNTEVTNKPTIGNGTITITQGGVTKGTFTTNQSGNSTIALDAGGGGGSTYTEGPGITIDQNNEISVNVDNNTIIIDESVLKANIPDVSDFVTNSSLADTLEAYPTNQALSNLVDYVTETETSFGQPISYPNTNITGLGVSDYSAVDSMMGFEIIDVHYDGPANSTRTIEVSNITDPNNPDIGYVKVGRALSSLADIYFPIGTESFYISGKTLSGEDVSFSSDDLPSFATYDNVEKALTFSEPIYVWSVEFYPLTAEGAAQSTSPRIHAYTNGIGGYAYNNQISTVTTTKAIIADTAVDGTTIDINSNGQLTANIPTPIRKTITQTSANVSESSGTITVTDTDVTTSTIVTLYPTDTDTETWLANSLTSNIITEGTGSFTFTINGTLPSTFSMYYIVQEVS